MYRSNIRKHVLIVLFLFFQGNLLADLTKPILTVGKLTQQPVIDGTLSVVEWSNCTRVSDYVVWTGDYYIPDSVVTWLGYDDQNLYLAFKGYFRDKQAFDHFLEEKKPIDSHLWGRHSVGFILGDGKSNIHVMAGPTLSLMDFKNGDLAWNGEYDFQASIAEDHWVGEFSIPFSNLDLNNAPEGQTLNLTLKRTLPSGVSSNWTGQITLESQKPVGINFGRWRKPQPGKNKIEIHLTNNLQSTQEVTCKIELIPFHGPPQYLNERRANGSSDMILPMRYAPLTFEQTIAIKTGESFSGSVDYNLPHESNYYATLWIEDDGGTILRRTTPYWFSIANNSERIDDLKRMLGEVESSGQDQKVPELLEAYQQNLKSLMDQKQAYWADQRWDVLSQKLDDLYLKVSRLYHRSRNTSPGGNQNSSGYGITLTHSLNKVKKDHHYADPVSSSLNLSAARNEFESFQVVLLPYDSTITGIELEMSPFENDQGKVLNLESDFYRVEYNLIQWQSRYVSHDRGWHPDPLIPLQSGESFTNRDDLCRPLWITLKIPVNAIAGNYTATLTVRADQGERTATVNLRVWDFGLPTRRSLMTHTWDDIGLLADFYNLEELPVEYYLNFCELLLENNLNPSFAGLNYLDKTPANGKYDFSTSEQILEFSINRGLSKFSLIQMKKGEYQPKELEGDYQLIKAYADFLRSKGWLDLALVELWDEPTVLQWTGVKERAEKIKSIADDIDLQLFVDADHDPYRFYEPEISRPFGLVDLIDVWMPFHSIKAPEIQAEGKEVWSYFCTLASGNAPNLFIDRPAIYQRSIGWYCWAFGLDGFEHWSTSYIWRNTKKGQPMSVKWPNTSWDSRTFHDFHGEGQLVYPGFNGEFYPSLRLEVFRDSSDDFEYLEILKTTLDDFQGDIKKRQAAQRLLSTQQYMLKLYPYEVQETLENTLRSPEDPELILEYREAIALAIEDLKGDENK